MCVRVCVCEGLCECHCAWMHIHACTCTLYYTCTIHVHVHVHLYIVYTVYIQVYNVHCTFVYMHTIPPPNSSHYIHVHVFTAAEVLAAPMTPDGPQEIGFRETKMSDPGKARQAERLGMGVGRVG